MKSTTRIVSSILLLLMPFGALAQTVGDLSITCAPNITSAVISEPVHWTATASGTSTSGLQYSWSGSEELSGTSKTVSIQYQTEGVKTASVTASTTNGVIATSNCSDAVTVTTQPISGSCSVSVQYIRVSGQYVEKIFWSVSPAGGVGDYTYLWSGDATGTNKTSRSVFTSPGERSASVGVSSGSQSTVLNCSVATNNPNLTATSSPLGGSCTASPLAPIINNQMTWRSEGTGGSGTYTYGWQGNATGATDNVQATYSSPGPETGTVVISDNTDSISLSCQTIVASSKPRFGGGGCFIATAAYGADYEPQVETLRKFRDTHLLTNAPGTVFVNAYYTVSPALADFISDKEPLKAAVRLGLDPIVFVINHF